MDDSLLQKTFTDNLNRYIELKGVSQKEISEAIGVSPQRLNTWSQGIAMPRMGKLQALADYFGVEKSDLIENKRDGYYFNKETARIAQDVYANPNLKLVFDACRNATPEELKQIARLAKAIRR